MRYIFIFVTTIILSLIIIFYKPYLGVYNEYITITLDDELVDYSWSYTLDNDNIILVDNSSNSWKFKVNKRGISNLYFIYSTPGNIKYKIFYKLKTRNNKIFWLEGYGEGILDYPNPK